MQKFHLPPNSKVIPPDAPIGCLSRFFFESRLEGLLRCAVNSGVRVEVENEVKLMEEFPIFNHQVTDAFQSEHGLGQPRCHWH